MNLRMTLAAAAGLAFVSLAAPAYADPVDDVVVAVRDLCGPSCPPYVCDRLHILCV